MSDSFEVYPKQRQALVALLLTGARLPGDSGPRCWVGTPTKQGGPVRYRVAKAYYGVTVRDGNVAVPHDAAPD